MSAGDHLHTSAHHLAMALVHLRAADVPTYATASRDFLATEVEIVARRLHNLTTCLGWRPGGPRTDGDGEAHPDDPTEHPRRP